jgi:hypothetical protein
MTSENINMWNLEGYTVNAYYMDEIPVFGIVTESRVTYGGSIKHTVKLLAPIPENSYGIGNRSHLVIKDSEVIGFRGTT